jgi:hypothetical protein
VGVGVADGERALCRYAPTKASRRIVRTLETSSPSTAFRSGKSVGSSTGSILVVGGGRRREREADARATT